MLELNINGKVRSVNAGPDDFLLEVVRDDLGLTGAKYGCGEGECGACTMLVDGAATKTCLFPLSQAVGKKIVTIEGLAKPGGKLHPLQEAFLEGDALQCGYCSAGMILAAHALLERNPNPTERQIRDHMRGNICRCCVYPSIVRAIQKAAKTLSDGRWTMSDE